MLEGILQPMQQEAVLVMDSKPSRARTWTRLYVSAVCTLELEFSHGTTHNSLHGRVQGTQSAQQVKLVFSDHEMAIAVDGNGEFDLCWDHLAPAALKVVLENHSVAISDLEIAA